MLKTIIKAAIYIGVVIITTLACGLLLGGVFSRYGLFWQKADLMPRGKIVRILSVGMIPMGHIDNVYVLS